LTAPTSKAKPFSDTGWVWELKHDGYRALLIREGERISLQTRKGNELLQFFPEIAANLSSISYAVGVRCVIPTASAWQRAIGRLPFRLRFVQLRGKDLRPLPLLKPKALLEKELNRAQRIVYCKHIGESGEKLFQTADQLRLEGVIGKKADSPYRAGRTRNWVKVKTAHGSESVPLTERIALPR
jgi:bifunctional non-homologous end joining protein LigD